MRLHKRYERDPKLVREKRKAAAAAGSMACEVCGFDFEKAYGELGVGYIDVHHTKPVHMHARHQDDADGPRSPARELPPNGSPKTASPAIGSHSRASEAAINDWLPPSPPLAPSSLGLIGEF